MEGLLENDKSAEEIVQSLTENDPKDLIGKEVEGYHLKSGDEVSGEIIDTEDNRGQYSGAVDIKVKWDSGEESWTDLVGTKHKLEVID